MKKLISAALAASFACAAFVGCGSSAASSSTAPAPAAPAASAASAPVQAVPVAPVAPAVTAAPVQAAATQASARKYTLHDISIAGAALIENGKMGDLSRLLNSFGVQAITQLDESRYEAFAAGMRSLGASI